MRPDVREYTRMPAKRKKEPIGILPAMRTGGTVAGVLLAAAGGIWILQGLNVSFAPQSFMTGDRGWVLYGAIAVLAGIGLVTWSRRGVER
jgi:hypothetical protein